MALAELRARREQDTVEMNPGDQHAMHEKSQSIKELTR
jgi:hypothetical protein